MSIRQKVLVLLAAIALIPQAFVIALDTHLLVSLSRDLTARNAGALAEQALSTMDRIASDYADTLDREARRVRLLLALQANEAERLLAAPPTDDTAPPVFFGEDFDRADRRLGLAHDPAPRVARERRGGAPLAVSWAHVSLHASPGLVREAHAPAARALAAMAGFYNTVREPDDPLLGWHYVVLDNGLSASWPGHGDTPADFDPRQRPWYEAQRARPTFRWYRPHRDASTGALLINATLPLLDDAGRFRGVTGIDVDLSSTFALLRLPPALQDGSDVLQTAVLRPPLVDTPHVVVLARQHGGETDSDWQTLPDLVPLDFGTAATTATVNAAMLAGENGHLRANVDGTDSFILYQRYGEGFGYVVIIVPVARATHAAIEAARHAGEATRTHVMNLLIVVGAVGVLVVIVALSAARHLSRPIEDLERAVERLARGDLGAQVAITTHDELRTLGDAFNGMVPRLKAHARTEESLALAHEVQQQLLPPTAPTLAGYDISGMTRYSEQTGGDFFDFMPFASATGSRTGIIVADVSGHGIGPSLLMATTRALLHGGRDRSYTPGQLLSYVNRELSGGMSRGHFVTLFLLALDAADGRLEWASAGHDPATVYRAASADVAELAADDIPLGIDADWTYAAHSGAVLAPGDIVIIGTDGIWESANARGERYGKARLRDYVARNAERPAQDLCAGLEAELHRFREGGAQVDDLTLVIVKRLPGA